MNKMLLALALVFVGTAVSLSAADNQIAIYLAEKYCSTTTTP